MAKPQYIQDIELKMIKLELYQKEQRITQDDILVEQAGIKRMVGQIHIKLMGTNYDQNGGMANDVNKLKKEVKELKTWKTRIVAAGSVISVLISFLAALIITQWNHVKEAIR